MSGSQARRRNRTGVLLIAMMLIAVLGIAPSSAITNGESDDGAHGFVGSMVIDIPDGYGYPERDVGIHQWCSGTLLDDDGGWFLTASHCLAGIPSFFARFPAATMMLTFDQEITPGGTFYDFDGYKAASNEPDSYYVHEEFGVPGRSDAHDVGLIKLASTDGLPTADLPAAGLLDGLKADHALRSTQFTTVGYGTIRTTQQGAFRSILDNFERNKAVQGFLSLTEAWLRLPMTPANGNGGTCFGDSGGPHFLGAGEGETNIVVSITVGGDAPCKALDTTYRMDTAATLAFLNGIMNP